MDKLMWGAICSPRSPTTTIAKNVLASRLPSMCARRVSLKVYTRTCREENAAASLSILTASSERVKASSSRLAADSLMGGS